MPLRKLGPERRAGLGPRAALEPLPIGNGLVMTVNLDIHTYVRDLEQSLQLLLFGCGGRSTAAVLLVRGALADGNHTKAAQLARATQDLAEIRQGESDMAAAACHVRGLVERDSAALELAAGRYSTPLSRAWAT